MEKIRLHKSVKVSFDGCSVDRAVEILKETESEIVSSGGSDIHIDTILEESYDECSPYSRIEFSYKILETDEEANDRIIRSEKYSCKNTIKKLKELGL